MKKNKPTIILCIALCFGLFACDDDNESSMNPIAKPDLEFYGLTTGNQLVKYNANAAATPLGSVAITGIASGEQVIGIDFRPATGQLYGVTNSSRLYSINHLTGSATAIGASTFSPAINGPIIGFDFNPTVDRIRLVTSSGQNLRLNPETGTVAATDAALNPNTPNIGASAYTSSFAGAASTTLFGIDLTTGMLYKQDPPNEGKLVEIGSLGIDAIASEEGGFDIVSDDAVALASLQDGTNSNLYQIDLTSGDAVALGTFDQKIIGLAIPTPPVAYAVDGSNNLHIFNLMTPGTPVSKPITGLGTGENVVGIDMRPATGQLFALGNSSRLYAINMATGAATAIGTTVFSTLLSGTSFGFDFNPTVDRLRIVSNTGQNLRVHPVTGELAFVDMALNPGTPAMSGVAYTNNFAGSTTTTLFDIDSSVDKLFRQDPPNNGTLVEIGSLGIDVDIDGGFDIGGTSNLGYAILTSGGSSNIYALNLTTGAASVVAPFPSGMKGFAIGLGF